MITIWIILRYLTRIKMSKKTIRMYSEDIGMEWKMCHYDNEKREKIDWLIDWLYINLSRVILSLEVMKLYSYLHFCVVFQKLFAQSYMISFIKYIMYFLTAFLLSCFCFIFVLFFVFFVFLLHSVLSNENDFKSFGLTHKYDPNRYYHSWSEWNWE